MRGEGWEGREVEERGQEGKKESGGRGKGRGRRGKERGEVEGRRTMI